LDFSFQKGNGGIKMPSRDEIWYVPKRTSVHQIIGLVEAVVLKSISGKTFRSGQQEALATELRKRGLTQSRNLSQQSVRTLLASGPQYLGLVYKSQELNTVKLFVTKAGLALKSEGNLESALAYTNLSEWEKNHPFPKSAVILNQLMKLIINNPVSENGGNFSVFPFRAAIELAIELGYIDFEELGYLVFQLQKHEDLPLLVQRIRNFRDLPASSRRLEIDAFKKTDAGNLSLVKAPSATYFMNICVYSGLFEIEQTVTSNAGTQKSIVLKDTQEAIELLESYPPARAYDFKGNLQLWIDYIGSPERKLPPRDYIIQIDVLEDSSYLVELKNFEGLKRTLTFDGVSAAWSVPMFEAEEYKLVLHSSSSPDECLFDIIPGNDPVINVSVSGAGTSSTVETFENSATRILEAIDEVMLTGWDSRIKKRTHLIKSLTGKDHLNNRTKGGRLEELFNLLLKIAESEGRVDSVRWYGKYGQDGIPGPAPGGKDGNPDLVFEIDDIAVVLELTTIKGTRAQWNSSEAASVPDHINSYIHEDPNSRVAGIFSAPGIDSRVRNTFTLHENKTKVPIICLDLNVLANLLSGDRESIKSYFETQFQRVSA
jgi:AlwI restriction endonuclease